MAEQNLLLPLSLLCSSELVKYYLQLKADLAASFLSESKLGSFGCPSISPPNYPLFLSHSSIKTVSWPPQVLGSKAGVQQSLWPWTLQGQIGQYIFKYLALFNLNVKCVQKSKTFTKGFKCTVSWYYNSISGLKIIEFCRILWTFMK